MRRVCTFLGLLLLVGLGAGAVEGRVGEYKGRQVFFIDDKPEMPFIYSGPGGMIETWDPRYQPVYKFHGELGFRLFQIETRITDLWTEDGRIDTDFVVRQIRGLREVCPEAVIILRVSVDAPQWYLKKYPEELIGYADGPVQDGSPDDSKRGQRRISFASEPWQARTEAAIRQFLSQLAKAPESEAIAGFHINCGEWNEWFWYDFRHEPDTGSVMTQHFRQWLRENYNRNTQALQDAWNDPNVTFDTASIPGIPERYTAKAGVFRDPKVEQRVIDYAHCHQQTAVDAALRFCRAFKQSWPRPAITGFFYGYLTHIHNMVTGGHLELERVLDSPYVDYLAGPLSYDVDARQLGAPGTQRSLPLSFRLHKKLYFTEMDQRPAVFDGRQGKVEPFNQVTIPDSLSILRRNFMQVFTSGQGLWLYDFGVQNGVPGGWWGGKEVSDEIRRLLQFVRAQVETPYVSSADVLFVYDLKCFYYLGDQFFSGIPAGKTDVVGYEAINRTIADAYHSGAALDFVLLSDLPRLDLTQYKVVVFAFTPYMTDADRTFIKERVARDGRTLVWVYAPGYADGKTLDLERMSELTGISLKRSPITLPPELFVPQGALEKESPEIRSSCYVVHSDYAPLFQVEDPNAQAVGFYRGTRYVALARKTLANSTSWFCALPLRDPALMQRMFRKAGAHIYTPTHDVVLAGGGLLAIHSEGGGKRTISLLSGRRVRIDLVPMSTMLMDLRTGEELLPNADITGPSARAASAQ